MFARAEALHKGLAPCPWSGRAGSHHARPVGAIIPLLFALLILQLHRGQPVPAGSSPLLATLAAIGIWACL